MLQRFRGFGWSFVEKGISLYFASFGQRCCGGQISVPGRLQNNQPTFYQEKAEKHFTASALQTEFLQNTCLYAVAGESQPYMFLQL